LCDTLVALGDATSDGTALFAKNSDRPPNEAQVVEYYPPSEYDKGAKLACTYIEIPQARRTYAVLLSRPFWMWGGEMGANEYGVAIGNEAVFSKEDVPETGLLGMDLLRLGLERGRSAREALDVIAELLEKHGQGGICELNGSMIYHNSFIIADKCEAWVLETSQRRWIAEKVDGVRSISNGYSIGENWDLASADLVEHAIEEGWCEDKSSFSFATTYGNEVMFYVSQCITRQAATSEFLEEKRAGLTFHDMAAILRNHPADWKPWISEEAPICQHTTHQRRDSSTCSQISELGQNAVHWLTGSSNPCNSIFMPFIFGSPYVYKGWNIGGEKYSDESFWWRRERVNRRQSEKAVEVSNDIHQYIEGLQRDIYEEAHLRFEQEILQRNLNEFEDFLRESSTTSENHADINRDYLDYITQLNSEAGIDSY
jgi:secernin